MANPLFLLAKNREDRKHTSSARLPLHLPETVPLFVWNLWHLTFLPLAFRIKIKEGFFVVTFRSFLPMQ